MLLLLRVFYGENIIICKVFWVPKMSFRKFNLVPDLWEFTKESSMTHFLFTVHISLDNVMKNKRHKRKLCGSLFSNCKRTSEPCSHFNLTIDIILTTLLHPPPVPVSSLLPNLFLWDLSFLPPCLLWHLRHLHLSSSLHSVSPDHSTVPLSGPTVIFPLTGLTKGVWAGSAVQSGPTLCAPMDYSLPGPSVHGIFLGKNTGVSYRALLQRVFPTHIKPTSLSPVLAGGFFTTAPSGKPSPKMSFHKANGLILPSNLNL